MDNINIFTMCLCLITSGIVLSVIHPIFFILYIVGLVVGMNIPCDSLTMEM